MKNKGFTLVELLAVIVILAIIMIIAIPAVLNIMQTAGLKTFEEFTLKSINETEKKIVSNSLIGETTGDQCEIYNIKNDLGLSNTGSFDGYILAKKNDDKYEYIITMWSDRYMLRPYNFTNKTNYKSESKDLTDSIENINENDKNLLTASNLCGFGCNRCKVNEEVIEATCFFSENYSFDFNYNGGEQSFVATCNGKYRLEVWGASGGVNIGNSSDFGKGGYSVGSINLDAGTKLYINVGGAGNDSNKDNQPLKKGTGGYNGGGSGGAGCKKSDELYFTSGAGGGGATHIATVSGLLKSLEMYKDTAGENSSNEILIVAGGGGGYSMGLQAGAGGGFKGTDGSVRTIDGYKIGGISKGGTQFDGYKFGEGQSANDRTISTSWGAEGQGGGGGGWYGGTASTVVGEFSNDAGAGGSGYINNPLLFDKKMFCLNCEETTELGYYTVNTKGTSRLLDNRSCSNGYNHYPISKCAKSGNGYARITYLG
ncbi:MAG: prepilin-type N-terminal cleavage/methylation domain-containing protein [Bacilli bacterium]|nr:prepilin-type N-terminal cleavage/methylation domain-containing protein [Bacilli bacterium]